MPIEIFDTPINDCKIIKTICHNDERGSFTELYSEKDYSEIFHFEVKQINCSVSKKDVIRGIHKVPYAKLVSCMRGTIFDIVVDLRFESPTYLKHYGTYISSNMRIYVPPNCGHAFLSLQDETIVVYAQSDIYNPEVEETIAYNDPKLKINWASYYQFILSEKDKNGKLL